MVVEQPELLEPQRHHLKVDLRYEEAKVHVQSYTDKLGPSSRKQPRWYIKGLEYNKNIFKNENVLMCIQITAQ